MTSDDNSKAYDTRGTIIPDYIPVMVLA